MSPERIENWIRHYDNLLWTTSSMLLAANGVLIIAFVQTKPDNCCFGAFIALVGLFLTLLTVYFAASFRKLRHGFNDKYDKDIDKENKNSDDATDIRKIRDAEMEQWLCYVLMFWSIAIFWSCCPILIYRTFDYALPCSIASGIVVTICFFVLHKKGGYKRLYL